MEQATEPRIFVLPPQSQKRQFAELAVTMAINYTAYYLGRRLVRWVVKTRHGRSV